MELSWTSIAAWLARAGLGGSLLIVVTLLAMRWVRQPARRQRLGELGMVAALVLAALCWAPAWLPIWEPAAPPAPVATMQFVLTPAADPAEEPVHGQLALKDEVVAAAPVLAEIAASPFDFSDWILPAVVVAYGLGAAFYLVRWLTGVVVLWRIVRAAQPAAPELLAEFHAKDVANRRPRLLISHQLEVPASCGVFRPTLILPAALAAAECSPERDWVFDHELTHLARHDAWSAVLFALGQMCYFALPWFWWLKRVVRLCQEYVADAAACRQRPADEYAEFLLSLTSAPAAPLAATGVTGTSSDLYRRVSMLLQNPVRVELSCPRAWTVAAAGVLLGLAVIAAGVGPAQAQPPNQKEVLDQLQQIQEMVNKLRGQIADQPRDVIKLKAKPHVIVVDVDDVDVKVDVLLKNEDLQAREMAVRKALLFLQKSQAGEADKQRAQAELERARAELQWMLAQIERQAADPKKAAAKQKQQLDLERAAAAERQGARANYDRALTAQELVLYGYKSRGTADKELKAAIEILQKHLADLKDSDAATKQAVQDAVNKLKDVLKKQAAVPAPPTSATPKVSSPVIRTLTAPVPPLPPVQSKPAFIVTAPRDVYLVKPQVAGEDGVLHLWQTTAAQPTGRLGIRVDAPDAILADQLNLPKDQGLVIAEVYDNSIAKKAGIKVNDILLKINQQAVANDPQKLIKQVVDIKADAPFDIVVLRRGKQETIQNVRLPEQAQPRLTAYRTLGSLVGGKDVRVAITAKHTGNTITLHRNEGPIGITVTAEVADGKAKVTGIAIVEKDKTAKYEKVNEVPEPNRAKVQHLLQLLDSVVPANPTPSPKTGTLKLTRPDGSLEQLPLRFEFTLPKEKPEEKPAVVDPAPRKPTPPPAKVSGKVIAIDATQTNLVSISIGSDAGLSRDHTLETYRLDPPMYLGVIRIIDVTPQSAVGRLERVGTIKTPVRVGDSVSSSLISK